MKSLREHLAQVERDGISPTRGDTFAIEIGEECLIESYIVDVMEDGVVIHADDRAMELLKSSGCVMEEIRRYGAVGKNRAMGFSYAESLDEAEHCAECGYAMEACGCNEEALAHPQFEAEEDDAEAAHRKIQTPAYLRKAHGARDPDWKVSAQDLEKAKERSISGPEGLAALKRRMMELAGIHKEDDSGLVDKTLELTPTGPAGGEINEDPTTEEPLPTQEPEANQPTNIENPEPGAVAARAFDEAMMSEDDVEEAKYRGREVKLGKPMAGDIKKKKVYVRKPNGNIVKVEFGDKKMRIKKHIPARRKSFRARHNCDNPGPRWKARYWSCRAW